jgi:phosphotransferase family enzyme
VRSLAKPRVAVPPDAALPRMRRLLDSGAMAPILQRSLGGDAALEGVRARYLRYKPKTNLVVHYEAVVDGGRHDAVVKIAAGDDLERKVRKPQNVAMARAVDGRSPAANSLVYDAELDAMIQWLPLDLSLPALAEPPAELYRRLRETGMEVPGPVDEPRMVAYKPRRRAVLRVGGHILKAYAQEAEFRAAVAGLRSTSEAGVVPVAAFEAAFPDLRLTVQASLGGSAPARAADVAAEAGAILRDLQQLPLGDPTPAPPAHQLAAAAESAALVEAIAPGLRRRLEALVRRLEAVAPGDVPGATVVAHGDFHAGQLLRRGGELAVIDFDELCAAPPALDLATYAAHLVNGRDRDLDAARTVLEAAAGGYGERPDALDWYLATSILRRVPFPFRYLHVDWPDLVVGMVGAAEEVLNAD